MSTLSTRAARLDPRPLIAHVVYRFDTGGLENGIVNLVNRMPADRWRHAIVALTEAVPAFAARLQRSDVPCLSLHKPPGQGFWQWPALHRTFRTLRPTVVHTRNLAALEAQAAAFAAGVPVRVHGEHGRDVDDLHGKSRRHVWMRRIYRPFVHHYVALSRDLEGYLQDPVGVPVNRITRICNGVDTDRFCPPVGGARMSIVGSPFNDDPGLWLIGTVGRMQAVKDQTLLARAFVQLLGEHPQLRARLRLVLVGEGPLRQDCAAILRSAGVESLAWLPGERRDVPEVLRGLDAFVLPSLAEGVSNTILEAMACGLPVVATRVGANDDLVVAGRTGQLVPPGDAGALASALKHLALDPSGAAALGRAGREEVERRFALGGMVQSYQAMYEGLLPTCRSTG